MARGDTFKKKPVFESMFDEVRENEDIIPSPTPSKVTEIENTHSIEETVPEKTTTIEETEKAEPKKRTATKRRTKKEESANPVVKKTLKAEKTTDNRSYILDTWVTNILDSIMRKDGGKGSLIEGAKGKSRILVQNGIIRELVAEGYIDEEFLHKLKEW